MSAWERGTRLKFFSGLIKNKKKYVFIFFQVCEASWVPERGPTASVQRGKDQGRRKCKQGEMWEEKSFLVGILQIDPPSPHNNNTNANPRSSPTCPQYKARIRTSRLPNSFNRFDFFPSWRHHYYLIFMARGMMELWEKNIQRKNSKKLSKRGKMPYISWEVCKSKLKCRNQRMYVCITAFRGEIRFQETLF